MYFISFVSVWVWLRDFFSSSNVYGARIAVNKYTSISKHGCTDGQMQQRNCTSTHTHAHSHTHTRTHLRAAMSTRVWGLTLSLSSFQLPWSCWQQDHDDSIRAVLRPFFAQVIFACLPHTLALVFLYSFLILFISYYFLFFRWLNSRICDSLMCP